MGESKQCGNYFNWETCLLTEGEYETREHNILFMEKDPVVSFLWPWGLSLLLTEGLGSPTKLFEVWATSL